ncbi:transcriptional regulator, TetR family [Granulicella pectinivorans]|uniref:Transcriptional regulator, TetR family n=1 Tax=Granulicella pectinivorans TaxID=474950 RepID=A0A1I6LMZ3_9BACT|nr:TetR/AcrR family transcriptional regulator [Granulicella pectinivorans]SFS04811.1 transcriptional regulator, TetR family [Granulicella pectinivorans]
MPPNSTDPRIRRTRHLLQQALANLLATREFDKISIQEIADAATVNRVTFYDHYADKFALLDDMVATRCHDLITQRGITFDCSTALTGIVQALCDFLTSTPGPSCPSQQMEPHLESAVIRVVRTMLLDGIQRHPVPGVAPGMLASTVAWAMFGAVKEWFCTPNHGPSSEIVATVVHLIDPLMHVQLPSPQ